MRACMCAKPYRRVGTSLSWHHGMRSKDFAMFAKFAIRIQDPAAKPAGLHNVTLQRR